MQGSVHRRRALRYFTLLDFIFIVRIYDYVVVENTKLECAQCGRAPAQPCRVREDLARVK